jgi:hypothetical protein
LPLTVLAQPHTGNWVTNTNSGVARARGTYLSFLHQDDLWLPGRLKQLRQATLRHPDIGFFLHPSCFVTSRGTRAGAWTCPLPRHGRPLCPEQVLPRLLIQNFIAMPAPLFRRDAAMKAGPMDEKLWFTADWKLWLALISQGPMLYLPEILAGFRIHPASQTMVGARRPEEIARQIGVMLDEAFPVYLPDSRRARRVRRVAEMNTNLNRVLSAKIHGQPAGWSRLLVSFLRLGPVGWRCFFRDSRILQRVTARWRAGLALPSHPSEDAQD